MYVIFIEILLSKNVDLFYVSKNQINMYFFIK